MTVFFLNSQAASFLNCFNVIRSRRLPFIHPRRLEFSVAKQLKDGYRSLPNNSEVKQDH